MLSVAINKNFILAPFVILGMATISDTYLNYSYLVVLNYDSDANHIFMYGNFKIIEKRIYSVSHS